MSDEETVLGKRPRNELEPGLPTANEVDPEESDDDDVGPMPMPADVAGKGSVKKKRKGE